MNSHDISRDQSITTLARTGADAFVVLNAPAAPVRHADVLVVELADGRRVPARRLGVTAGSLPVDEATLIGAYCVDRNGVPLESMIDRFTQEASGHDWGALGLPDGRDTRVVPVDEHQEADDLTMADTSHGVRDLSGRSALTLAPGDVIDARGVTGAIVSIERRAGTIELDAGDANLVTVSIGEVDAISQSEPEATT